MSITRWAAVEAFFDCFIIGVFKRGPKVFIGSVIFRRIKKIYALIQGITNQLSTLVKREIEP